MILKSTMQRVILMNLAFIALGLAVMEAIFGTWFHGPPWGAMNIPRSIDREFDVSGLYPGRATIRYHRDVWGLRGRYERLDSIDILTLGGSTTDQRFIDNDDTWQELLRQRFAADNRTISVVNAGIDGQSTIGHLAAMRRWLPHIPDLKAKHILAYIGVNDVHVEAQAQYDAMHSSSPVRRAQKYLKNNSALIRLWDTASGNWQATRVHLVHGSGAAWNGPWIEPANPPEPQAEESHLEAYERRVADLIAEIRATGAEAIIVTQSRADYRVADGRPLGRYDTGKVETGSWSVQTSFNKRAMKACRAAGAICLDLGGELTFGDDDFYDWVHTTPSGNNRIAEYLYRHLRGRL